MTVWKCVAEVVGSDVSQIVKSYARTDFVRTKYERRVLYRFLTYDDWETKLSEASQAEVNQILVHTINAWVSCEKRPISACRFLSYLITNQNYPLFLHLAARCGLPVDTIIHRVVKFLALPLPVKSQNEETRLLACTPTVLDDSPVGILLYDFLLGNRDWVEVFH